MEGSLLLIVDDEAQNLAAMRQILSDEYRLAFASGGAEALAAARRLLPALILLDVRMPDIDGYSVCRMLRGDPLTEEIPVIFVTSLSDVGNEAAGFDAGAVDYVVKPASPPIVRARVRTHLSLVKVTRLERSHRDAIGMLGVAGHYNDNDTGVHIWRMAAYARALAEAFDWSQERAELLELAAPMHDTGKIGIPDAILRKPGKLDDSEWTVMKTHCQIGYEILSRSDAPVFLLAAQVALRHHEKWDGSGYPDGLAGQLIPECARIVAVADVFDALSMRRPYKDPWPVERIVTFLQEGAGNHFDPRMIDRFTAILPRILAIQSEWQAREEGTLPTSAIGEQSGTS